MTKTERLADGELALIREECELWPKPLSFDATERYYRDIPRLLAEVKALRKELDRANVGLRQYLQEAD